MSWISFKEFFSSTSDFNNATLKQNASHYIDFDNCSVTNQFENISQRYFDLYRPC